MSKRSRTEGVMGDIEHVETMLGSLEILEWETKDLRRLGETLYGYATSREIVDLKERVERLEEKDRPRPARSRKSRRGAAA